MSYWVLSLFQFTSRRLNEKGIGPRLRAGMGSVKAWKMLQIASELGEGAVGDKAGLLQLGRGEGGNDRNALLILTELKSLQAI